MQDRKLYIVARQRCIISFVDLPVTNIHTNLIILHFGKKYKNKFI